MDNVHGLLGGRFYELYGYDPGFSGDGSSCVKELVAAHPDKFERSSSPKCWCSVLCYWTQPCRYSYSSKR